MAGDGCGVAVRCAATPDLTGRWSSFPGGNRAIEGEYMMDRLTLPWIIAVVMAILLAACASNVTLPPATQPLATPEQPASTPTREEEMPPAIPLKETPGGPPAGVRPPTVDPTYVPTLPPFIEHWLPVEKVEIDVHSAQPEAKIEGYLPESCVQYSRLEQSRQGNRVEIQIFIKRPSRAACLAVITPYSTVVTLEGDFPPGEYAAVVNGQEYSFRVP
jgi:hypothetical protein